MTLSPNLRRIADAWAAEGEVHNDDHSRRVAAKIIDQLGRDLDRALGALSTAVASGLVECCCDADCSTCRRVTPVNPERSS